MILKTKVNSVVSHIEKVKRKTWRGGKGDAGGFGSHFLERESVFLLSTFLRDPTVGSLRDKKESCSTRRGFRVGTD